jgi:hypothetical protein
MRQAQSVKAPCQSSRHRWIRSAVVYDNRGHADRPSVLAGNDVGQIGSWSLVEVLIALLSAVWFVVQLPFRLVFYLIACLGRLVALVVGFSLMVIGMALLAGPLFWLGIPLFITGLVLTLRCLD